MFLVDWLYGVLASLGMWQKKANIMFLGRKDTANYRFLSMFRDQAQSSPRFFAFERGIDMQKPADYSTCEELTIGKIKCRFFDLGEPRIARRVWRNHFARVDAVVYVVDGGEEDICPDFTEPRRELDELLSDEILATVPFLILVHKYDAETNPQAVLFRYRLGLERRITGEEIIPLEFRSVLSPLNLFVFSVSTKKRCTDAFVWLSRHII